MTTRRLSLIVIVIGIEPNINIMVLVSLSIRATEASFETRLQQVKLCPERDKNGRLSYPLRFREENLEDLIAVRAFHFDHTHECFRLFLQIPFQIPWRSRSHFWNERICVLFTPNLRQLLIAQLLSVCLNALSNLLRKCAQELLQNDNFARSL